MNRKTNVITIFSLDVLLLLGCGVIIYLIFGTLSELKEVEQKNNSIIQHPYLSEEIRVEQKGLLSRAEKTTTSVIQNPEESIALIQEIEALAIEANIELEVRLNEQDQRPIGTLTLVPIQFTGSGPWEGVIAFQRALRQSKPGFFLNSVSLSNESGNMVRFTYSYELLWQGKL